MANRWEIPQEIELRLKQAFRLCAYCGKKMRSHAGILGCPQDKATFEHLNRHGPFRWSDGLREEHLVIACAQCNSSRGRKLLSEWFMSEYCIARGISPTTVAAQVKRYLRTTAARR